MQIPYHTVGTCDTFSSLPGDQRRDSCPPATGTRRSCSAPCQTGKWESAWDFGSNTGSALRCVDIRCWWGWCLPRREARIACARLQQLTLPPRRLGAVTHIAADCSGSLSADVSASHPLRPYSSTYLRKSRSVALKGVSLVTCAKTAWPSVSKLNAGGFRITGTGPATAAHGSSSNSSSAWSEDGHVVITGVGVDVGELCL